MRQLVIKQEEINNNGYTFNNIKSIRFYENKLLIYANAIGSEKWYKYNDNGNKIYTKTTNKEKISSEEWFEYDKNNNIKHMKNTTNYATYERWYFYLNDKLNHTSDSSGTIVNYLYDDKGNCISVTTNDGELVSKSSFDEQGNCTYTKNFENGYEEWFKYDKNNNLIYYKTNFGQIVKNIYNENNKLIESEHSTGFVTKYSYNQNGDVESIIDNDRKIYFKYYNF